MFFDRIATDREVRGLQDFVWIPRFENSFNLSETQTVLAGVSGAFGSNETGANSRTQILRRRPALQMEKRACRRRVSIREMADRIHVSPFRSRARRGRFFSCRGNISRLGSVFAGAVGI